MNSKLTLITVLLITSSACSATQPKALPLKTPFPVVKSLKTLIQSGFKGEVAGFPESASQPNITGREYLFSDKPRFAYPLKFTIPAYSSGYEDVARQSGIIGSSKEDEHYALLPLLSLEGAHRKNAYLRMDSFQQGEVEDLEILYRSRFSTPVESWVPYLLFAWDHEARSFVERKGVYLTPRFEKSLSLSEQLETLGIKRGEPIWVHPRVGMLYLVSDPTPKAPVYFLVTTPKNGPPQISAIMDSIGEELAARNNFLLYPPIAKQAFKKFNEGAKPEDVRKYEPYLVCDALNDSVQQGLAKLVTRVRDQAKSVSIDVAFAALKECKNSFLMPLILADAQSAGFKQGLMNSEQLSTLKQFAGQYLTSLNESIKSAAQDKRYGTAAGLSLIRAAVIGEPFADAQRCIEAADFGRYQKLEHGINGTNAQRYLTLALEQLPLSTVETTHASGNPFLYNAPGTKLLRLTGDQFAKNYKKRKNAGVQEWYFQFPKINVDPAALTVSNQTQNTAVAYRVYTPEYQRFLKKLGAASTKTSKALASVPVVTKTTTRTRDEWVRVEYVSGNRSLGTTWGVRPVTSTQTVTGPDYESVEYYTYLRARDEEYRLLKQEPKNKYLTKYHTMPVEFQIWDIKQQNWTIDVRNGGNKIGEFPVSLNIGKALKRHQGVKKYNILAVNEWKKKSEVFQELKNQTSNSLFSAILRRANKYVIQAMPYYVKTQFPKASEEQRAEEAAWLLYFLGKSLNESEAQLLPMKVLKQIAKDPSDLALHSIASAFRKNRNELSGLRMRKIKPTKALGRHLPLKIAPYETPKFNTKGKLSGLTIHVNISQQQVAATMYMIDDLLNAGAKLGSFHINSTGEGKPAQIPIYVNRFWLRQTKRERDVMKCLFVSTFGKLQKYPKGGWTSTNGKGADSNAVFIGVAKPKKP